jgi:hypothetical protein
VTDSSATPEAGSIAESGASNDATAGALADAGDGAAADLGDGDAAIRYVTDFSASESPISEGGAWRSGDDPLQTPVDTAGGLAFGTQTGTEARAGNYNDSEAYLSGFPPDQRATAVIHKTAGVSNAYEEVELLLRWSVGALRTGLPYGDTHSYGYEINLAYDGAYIQIGRFKSSALFDSLVSGSPVTGLGVKDGDVFSAQIVGNAITATLTRNGVTTTIAQATDSSGTPFATGSPGIGFFRDDSQNGTTDPKAFCFTHFEADGL